MDISVPVLTKGLEQWTTYFKVRVSFVRSLWTWWVDLEAVSGFASVDWRPSLEQVPYTTYLRRSRWKLTHNSNPRLRGKEKRESRNRILRFRAVVVVRRRAKILSFATFVAKNRVYLSWEIDYQWETTFQNLQTSSRPRIIPFQAIMSLAERWPCCQRNSIGNRSARAPWASREASSKQIERKWHDSQALEWMDINHIVRHADRNFRNELKESNCCCLIPFKWYSGRG